MAKLALKVPARIGNVRGGTLLDLVREAVKISAAGLQRRAVLNSSGADESGLITPLIEVVESDVTSAERKLALYFGAWQGDIDRVFREFAY